MVASEREVKTIIEILRQYWPDVSIEMMLQQVWEDVGERTDNESLKRSIERMLVELTNAVDWMKKT
jgi:isocitrate dehydrogenase kinase/phosphatase|tara:strand:+ start:1850 stop:2047 length:198 start_codon:yes stop_codon:yes gene_type:complete